MKRNRTLETYRTAAQIWIEHPSMTPLQAYRKAEEALELADTIIARLKERYREEWQYHANTDRKEWWLL